ncbi:MAG TPA: hypothetical protein VNO33_17520, partial [Kofleriaceae bacterium]|nr:hypothetical protein [Kofleriaceae bacterium]
MRLAPLLVSVCLALAGCAGDDDGETDGSDDQSGEDDGGGADDGADGGDDGGGGGGEFEHDFPGIDVASGAEVTRMCLSWTVGNEETLFVNSVTMNAGPGWHHSNWFYVPAGTFPVDDGAWECAGEFDQIT